MHLRFLASSLVLFACGSSVETGTGGGGGEGGAIQHFDSCDAIGVCLPPGGASGVRVDRSCLECAVAGDTEVAPNGGACKSAYEACFGTDEACTGGSADCCAFADCLDGCPADNPATGNLNENLACICTTSDAGTPNDASDDGCVATSLPGTCVGDHGSGFALYQSYSVCVFGEAPTAGVCQQSCN